MKRIRTLGMTSVLLGLVCTTWAFGQAAAKKEPAKLRVMLPNANATLTIDNAVTQQGGAERTYMSPALEPGRTYTYVVTAVWEPNNYTRITRTREVKVTAGSDLEVDLRQEDNRWPDNIKVRYVPTPADVVDAMVKLAQVGKNDVVYDLGCGDGRMVIAAVKTGGAKRGVGVDIDPERVRESKANAKAAGVEDKVEFRVGDVLEIADLSTANVVLLYMGNDINLRLKPILQKTLKPGSRVVSHRFTMGDWKPDETQTIVDKKGEKFLIHLWTISEPGGKK